MDYPFWPPLRTAPAEEAWADQDVRIMLSASGRPPPASSADVRTTLRYPHNPPLYIVESASVHEGEVPEAVADGLCPPLAAIEDEQDPVGHVQAAIDQVREQPRAHRGVLGGALLQPQDVLVPV